MNNNTQLEIDRLDDFEGIDDFNFDEFTDESFVWKKKNSRSTDDDDN